MFPAYSEHVRQKEGPPAKYSYKLKANDFDVIYTIALAKVRPELAKKYYLDLDRLHWAFCQAHSAAEKQLNASYVGTKEDLMRQLKDIDNKLLAKPLPLHLSVHTNYGAIKPFLPYH